MRPASRCRRILRSATTFSRRGGTTRTLWSGRRLTGGAGTLVLATMLALGAGPVLRGQSSDASSPPEPPAKAPRTLPIHVPGSETVEVRLVRVPVTVVDGDRQPVIDLTRDDFELRVDGQLVPVATFDAPDSAAGTRAAPVSPPVPGGESSTGRRWAGARVGISTALVIDLYQSRPISIQSSISAIRAYLATGVPADTRTGLFMITHGQMRTVVPFTSDAAGLLDGLASIVGNIALRDGWIQDEAARQAEIASYVVPSASGDGLTRLTVNPVAGSAVRGYSDEQAARNRHVLHAVEALAAAMARRPGRKNIVFVGDGLREQAGMNYVGGILQQEAQSSGLAMGSLRAQTVSLRDEFRDTMRVLREAGVTFSPVSMVGLYNPMRLDPDAWSDMLGSMQDLARWTGGRRPAALNGFAEEVAGAANQTAFTYLLGFRPIRPDHAGTPHKITVRVNRPRVTVTARSEYVYRPPHGFDRITLFAGATLLPEEFDAVPLDTTVRVFPAPDNGEELHVQIRLPIESLSWVATTADRRVTEIEVSGMLRGSNGRTQLLFDTGYQLDVDAVAPPQHVVIQEARTVTMPPDPDLVVVVEDRTSERIGSAVSEVPVLAHRAGSVRLSATTLIAPVDGVYLLTPTGEPLLGLHGDLGLFLPGRPATDARLVIALARVDGLPEGASVRFCTDPAGHSCVTAGLRPYVPLPTDVPTAAEPSWERTRTAWVALDPELTAHADQLIVKVVDAAGDDLSR
ncbi:MAG: VWA domain-containing protein [Acidobacteriota bacterium]